MYSPCLSRMSYASLHHPMNEGNNERRSYVRRGEWMSDGEGGLKRRISLGCVKKKTEEDAGFTQHLKKKETGLNISLEKKNLLFLKCKNNPESRERSGPLLECVLASLFALSACWITAHHLAAPNFYNSLLLLLLLLHKIFRFFFETNSIFFYNPPLFFPRTFHFSPRRAAMTLL